MGLREPGGTAEPSSYKNELLSKYKTARRADLQALDLADKSLPATLNGLHRRVREGLEAAVEAGVLLTHIKEELPHGEFEKWIKSNCYFSVRTARNYMRAAAAFKSKSATVADLQEVDSSEEKKDIVPPSLYSCDFRLIERIQPESIDWVITDPPYGKEHLPLYATFSPTSLPGHSAVDGCGSLWIKSQQVRVLYLRISIHR